MLIPWLVVRPFDLYPRFYLWVVPGVAVLVGRGVARQPKLLALALVGAIAALAPQVSSWTTPELANRAAAEQLGGRAANVCILGWSGEAGLVYSPAALLVISPAEMASSENAIVLQPDDHPDLVAAARRHFTTENALSHARRPGLLFRDPIANDTSSDG